MSTVNKVLDYIKNVLEVPRKEYSGMSACPFAKKERETDNIYIDTIGEDNGFLECMKKFLDSEKNSAVFIQKDEISEYETIRYQKYLNTILKELKINKYFKTLCINPNDELDVDGLNVRSQAPCFLILVNPKKEIQTAHENLLKTKYYDNMSDKYKKYLGVK